MNCSCIKKKYDVHISHSDCKHLIYEDQSVWMAGDQFAMPDTYDVKIHIPSRSKEVTLTLSPNKRNVLTSLDLFGLEDTCLPDDFYCFTVTSCGQSYTVYRAFLCNVECKLDELLTMASTETDFDEIQVLKSMLAGIAANTNLGRLDTAKNAYRKLQKRLKYLDCGKC